LCQFGIKVYKLSTQQQVSSTMSTTTNKPTKLKTKTRFKRLRRLFQLRRKDLTGDDDPTYLSKTATLAWSPEEIFDEMNDLPIPSNLQGQLLLMEVGGVDQGWVMDFTGDSAGGGEEGAGSGIVISRYDIPDFSTSSGRAPNGPRISSSDERVVKTLPWVWYKDRKVFSKIESGKLSDMAAFVTGRIAASGDTSKFDAIDQPWKDAKDKAAEKKKTSGNGAENNDDDDEEEEEEEVDQEAKIIATFKPDVEPTDPRTKEFWKRHFGTDMLVASYLYLISSIFFVFLAVGNYFRTTQKLDKETMAHETYMSIQAHSGVNIFMAALFAVASIYFIKLSYPETTMLMAYRVMTKDPSSLTFVERYFTANEMLVATWLMNAAFVVPFVLLALFELIVWHEGIKCIRDLMIVAFTLPLVGLLSVAAMPDNMRANGGKGSTYFFDYFWVPLLRLKGDDERIGFWVKHVGSDGIAGMWIMAVLGVVGGVAVIPPVIIAPYSPMAWYSFWSTIPFTVGSLLMVRASYPEYMNSSIFFSDEDSSSGSTQQTSSSSSQKTEVDPESAPLLP